MKIGLEISKPFQRWASVNKRIKIAFGGRGGTGTVDETENDVKGKDIITYGY